MYKHMFSNPPFNVCADVYKMISVNKKFSQNLKHFLASYLGKLGLWENTNMDQTYCTNEDIFQINLSIKKVFFHLKIILLIFTLYFLDERKREWDCIIIPLIIFNSFELTTSFSLWSAAMFSSLYSRE